MESKTSDAKLIGFDIKPNPSTNEFHITSGKDLPQFDSYEIVNLWGEKVEFKSFQSPISDFKIGSSLIPGVYFLRVKQNGQIGIQKLIKH